METIALEQVKDDGDLDQGCNWGVVTNVRYSLCPKVKMMRA